MTVVEQTDQETLGDERPSIEFAVVIPTFNERDNISPLIGRLESVLEGINWEVIFVDDDSPDQTAELVRQIAMRKSQVR
jgi:dolichol-phosphate mannosyltransferase